MYEWNLQGVVDSVVFTLWLVSSLHLPFSLLLLCYLPQRLLKKKNVNFLPFFFSSEPFQLLVSGFLLFSQYLFLPPLSSSSSLGLSSRQSRVPPTRLLFVANSSPLLWPPPLAPLIFTQPTVAPHEPPHASSCPLYSKSLQRSTPPSLLLSVCQPPPALLIERKRGKKKMGGIGSGGRRERAPSFFPLPIFICWMFRCFPTLSTLSLCNFFGAGFNTLYFYHIVLSQPPSKGDFVFF